jgi:hypothetical protein
VSDYPSALADRLRNMVRNPNAIGTHSEACWQWHDDCALLLAAALLRRHADLLDAIGDPDELQAMVRSLGLNSIEEDRTLTKRVADIADAVDGPT